LSLHKIPKNPRLKKQTKNPQLMPGCPKSSKKIHFFSKIPGKSQIILKNPQK
jgi:hypothetical protein